jgi:DNA-binding MarR family transcriptional regulator
VSRGNTPTNEGDVERFRKLVQTFVRDFGLLVSTQTPCGHSVSISHAHALMVLLERYRSKEAMSQADLGKSLGIDKSNVARLCGKMEEVRHVSQTRPPSDGRARLVELTEKGAGLARQIERASIAKFRRILTHVEARRRAPLFDSLSNLNAAVAALRDPKDAP